MSVVRCCVGTVEYGMCIAQDGVDAKFKPTYFSRQSEELLSLASPQWARINLFPAEIL